MSDIIFAHPRHSYDSYTDYRKLVELSQFPTCFIDEIDLQSDNLYIVSPMNGEFDAHIDWRQLRKCQIYHWNLERPGAGSISDYKGQNSRHIREGKIDHVLVSDKLLARLTGFKYVVMGSHDKLGIPGEDKTYDYIHLMCYSPRRGPFFNYPNALTAVDGMTIAPNSWGQERHEALQRSKMMLNIHQDEHPYCEPLRFTLAAAYGLPIVTEHIPPENNVYETCVLDMHGIGYSMRHWLTMYDNRGGRLRESGMVNRNLLTGEYSFRRCIERFV